MKAPNEAERCEVCDWPYEQTGCQPGNCSYRPNEGTAEYDRIQKRRERLKAGAGPCAAGEPQA